METSSLSPEGINRNHGEKIRRVITPKIKHLPLKNITLSERPGHHGRGFEGNQGKTLTPSINIGRGVDNLAS